MKPPFKPPPHPLGNSTEHVGSSVRFSDPLVTPASCITIVSLALSLALMESFDSEGVQFWSVDAMIISSSFALHCGSLSSSRIQSDQVSEELW